MTRFYTLIVFIFFAFFTQAQKTFKPQNLGDNVNSIYSEINPILSSDGKILYFIRVNAPENSYGGTNSQDIWFSELLADGTWGLATRIEDKMNRGRFNAILGINKDGNQILVSGKFKKNGTYYAPGLSFMYLKGEDTWTDPKKINIPGLKKLLRGKSFNASLSPDGKFIVISATTNAIQRKSNIYISENVGNVWSKLKPIKFENFKLSDSEEAPFLTGETNNLLYFSSKKEKGVGNYDIYVAARTSSEMDEWLEPKLIESLANTVEYESFFKPNIKLTEAYYVSASESRGGTDIMKIKLRELNPFVVVSGKIYNKLNNKPMLATKGYNIKINGNTTDSVKINFDSSSYTVRLPFGKRYKIEPSLKNWAADSALYDATNVKEYVEVKQDLYLNPLPYVKVSGNFLMASTRSYVPYNANVKLCINNIPYDSTTFETKQNAMKASYEVKLPWGSKYILYYKGPKYTIFKDSIDLTSVDEYKEITKDLYGEKIEEKIEVAVAMATVVGKVMNKKTNKPFANILPYVIQVDKLPYPFFEISSTTGTYSLILPLSNTYTINARADGYYPVFETLDISKEKVGIKIFKDLVIAPIEVGVAVRMNNIFFQSGKSILDPKSFPELDKFAKFLLDNPTIAVEIGGHTDNVGKKDKNLLLSRWRARAVEVYLEGKGANKDKVTFNGYGSTKPVADNKTPKGKALNRRVEFTIKGIE